MAPPGRLENSPVLVAQDEDSPLHAALGRLTETIAKAASANLQTSAAEAGNSVLTLRGTKGRHGVTRDQGTNQVVTDRIEFNHCPSISFLVLQQL